eukprot:53932-Eustigmatos_ZCMA.PRE.1
MSSNATAAEESAAQERDLQRQVRLEQKLIRPDSGKKVTPWKSEYIFITTENKEHTNDFYCMECRKWFKKAQSANVRQHLQGAHGPHWAALVAKYEGKGQGDGSEAGASSAVIGSGVGDDGSDASGAVDGGKTIRRVGQLKIGVMHGQPLMRLHRSLVGFLVRDMRPFNLIEGQGFIR